MTAIVLPFAVQPSSTATPPTHALRPATRIACQSAEEAGLAAQLLLACAAPRHDRLDAVPTLMKREGQPYRPLVVVHWGGLDVIASADAMRRIALTIDFAGRQGAALDLLGACDTAEALANQLQRSHH